MRGDRWEFVKSERGRWTGLGSAGDGDTKRVAGVEKGNLGRRGIRISRKKGGMRKGSLCKYHRAHYHFKTLKRKSLKIERSIF